MLTYLMSSIIFLTPFSVTESSEMQKAKLRRCSRLGDMLMRSSSRSSSVSACLLNQHIIALHKEYSSEKMIFVQTIRNSSENVRHMHQIGRK